MINRLYLADAFGWDTESKAKVAIAQLREEKIIDNQKCPKAQLIYNESVRGLPNLLKMIGYIPVINIFAGILAITQSPNNSAKYEPNHSARWKMRGVAMILTGPLLLIVDAIKFVYELKIANKYGKDHPKLMEAFNPSHKHTIAYWPGHPVDCIN